MDTTLTINPGSASKKYALFQEGKVVLKVLFERTNDGFGKCVEVNGGREHVEEITESAYDAALVDVLQVARRLEIIDDAGDICRVAVRIVAPGTYFQSHRIIDAGYVRRLGERERMAPLHIPHILEEIKSAEALLTTATIVGISDSAFHVTIPNVARIYSVAKSDAQALDLYRFGYHGLSVASVLRRAEHEMGSLPERTVVLHLGSGVSITAVHSGESIDTTMGYGPGSGLMMNTRGGDLDPSVLVALMEGKGLDARALDMYVNKSSGLQGLLGSSDLRIALDRRGRGEHEVIEATNAYFYRIRKALGGAVATLGGIDLLILTATAAERSPIVRKLATENLAHIGITLDVDRNESLLGQEGVVSSDENPVTIRVIHTNEMAEMARIAGTVA